MSLTISSPTPTNGTLIPSSASVQFTLTDTSVSTFGGCQVTIVATYPSGVVELVYATAISGYAPVYSQGSAAPPTGVSISSGGVFTITRAGGWPADPSLSVSVSDTSGNTASASWAWHLAVAPVSPALTPPPNPAAQSPYGSDCRTYAPLPDGTLGVDPYFLLVQDPNVVMTETIARIISTPTGALWYAPTQGYDLRSLINATTNGDFSSVQGAVVRAVTIDQRFQACSCLISPIGNGSYRVNVNGVGAAGPFSTVFLLSSAGVTALSFS